MKTVLAAWLVCLSAAAASAQDAAALRIYMARTACYGTCPVYSVEMRGDGRVTYKGQENVRVGGTRTWTIDRAAVRALASEMERAGFFEMKDDYSAPVTDLPTVHTVLTSGGRSKVIKDYVGAPAALKLIEARIDAVSGVRAYVSVNAAAIREMRAEGWRPTGDDAVRWMDRALAAGDKEAVKALLDAGMSARAADANGITLVMKAAESGDPDTVRLVLSSGGDPTARDFAGRNAADRARAGMDPTLSRFMGFVESTGRPRDYAAILRLLTDE